MQCVAGRLWVDATKKERRGLKREIGGWPSQEQASKRRSDREKKLGRKKRVVVTMRGGAGRRSVSSNAMLLVVWQPEWEDGMSQ